MKKTLIVSGLLALATAGVYASNGNFNIKEAIITTELTKGEIVGKNVSTNIENPENKELIFKIKSGLTENFYYDEYRRAVTTKETLPVGEHEVDYEICEEPEKLNPIHLRDEEFTSYVND